MITVVDRTNTHEIQKITDTKGRVIRYQVVAADRRGDTDAVKVSDTLTAARAMIGKSVSGKPLNKPTLHLPI